MLENFFHGLLLNSVSAFNQANTVNVYTNPILLWHEPFNWFDLFPEISWRANGLQTVLIPEC